MKKIFNTLLITFVVVLSSLMFSTVYAEEEQIVCKYSNWTLTMAKKKDKIYVKKVEPANYTGSHYTKDVKVGTLRCPTTIFVKEEMIPNLGSDYYFSSTDKKGYTAISLTSGRQDKNCVEWDDIKSKYNTSSYAASLEELISGTNNPNSYITYNGKSFSVKAIDSDTTCEQFRQYNLYYFNTLNPTYSDGKTKVQKLSEKLQKVRGELLKTTVCKSETSEYTATISKIDEYQKKVDSFLRAGHYESENVKKYLAAMKAAGTCDIDPDALDKYIDKDLTAVDKFKKEALIVGSKLKFEDGCAILDGGLKDFLNTLLFYIRVAAIVLAVVLSLLDYIKATAGTDDKPMAKANSNFMTRLILIIVLFLLPAILSFMLNALNIKDTSNVSSDSIECLNK